MDKSTIYFKCPGCGETALIQQLQGMYVCSNCNFDYTKLKNNPRKLDEILIENMRGGAMGQIMALTIHKWITLMPHQESIIYVKNLAINNGIEWMGDKKGCIWTIFERIFLRKKIS